MTNTTTLTARQRLANPAKYVRKDARGLVLRIVYGERSNASKRPEELPFAALSFATKDDRTAAVSRVLELLPLCQWPQWKSATILRHLRNAAIVPVKEAA